MKASELILELQKEMVKYGDLDIILLNEEGESQHLYGVGIPPPDASEDPSIDRGFVLCSEDDFHAFMEPV